MSRLFLPLAVLASFPALATADAPKSDPVDRELAVQTAMAAAEQYLAGNRPGEAVAILEAQVGNADGSRAFLTLLRRGYAAELAQLEANPKPDPNRAAEVRRRLNLLGGPPPKAEEPAAPPATAPAGGPMVVPAAPPAADGADLQEARALFNQKRYPEASAKFAAAVARQAPVTQEEVAAWAYCRVKIAASKVNDDRCDPATAAAVEKDVTEALQLAPGNADLQRVGQSVLVVARQRKAAAPPAAVAQPAPAALPAGWEVVETASFRVRFHGTRDAAEAVARAAEEKRKEIFERWSGPPNGAWAPRCEVVLHPTADCYAKMTGRPAQGTGHATVRLTAGRVTERTVELRADDPGVLTNTLPRELTHVVLADLFPDSPPPKWAEEGMAVLAGSPDEVGRYARTLPRCARNGELFPMAVLLDMKEFPGAEKITGFYCQSVSLVDYLVRLKGEKQFKLFLGLAHRYGVDRALKDTYGLDGRQALEQAWKRAALDTPRGQAP